MNLTKIPVRAGILIFTIGCTGSAARTQPKPLSDAKSPMQLATSFDYVALNLPVHFTVGSVFGGGGGRGGGTGGNAPVISSDNSPSSDVATNDGVALGRVLFYDKKLSANAEVACASCQVQAFGFADTAKLSTGFSGGATRRHAMSLANVVRLRDRAAS